MPDVSTMQTQMKVFNGLAPNLDGNHIIDDISFKQHVVAKSADYTVQGNESGTVFIATQTSDIEFTLPAVATAGNGFVCWFFQTEDYEMLITAPANTFILDNNATADGLTFTTASEHIGNGVMCVCNGTYWLAFIMPGDSDATSGVISA